MEGAGEAGAAAAAAAAAAEKAEDDGELLSSDVTVILTTSPSPSHPSLELVAVTLASFKHVKGLDACRKIIVCDGYRRKGKKSRPRRGVVTEELDANYKAYKDRLAAGVFRPSY